METLKQLITPILWGVLLLVVSTITYNIGRSNAQVECITIVLNSLKTKSEIKLNESKDLEAQSNFLLNMTRVDALKELGPMPTPEPDDN